MRSGEAPAVLAPPPAENLPVIAIVGRPNVGKSTLFNRLTRTRRSIVGDEPGITRDRIYGVAEFEGRRVTVVDTGGILPDDPEIIPEAIYRQARVAIEEALAILFVVDGRTPLAAPDLQLAQLLLRSGKPVLLLVNKIETDQQLRDLGPYYELGLQPVFPVSAEHNHGLEEVRDYLRPLLPPEEFAADEQASAAALVSEERPRGSQRSLRRAARAAAATAEAEKGVAPLPEGGSGAAHEATEAGGEERRPSAIVAAGADAICSIAIIGRPNVGKSTLLNQLTGEERSIVSDIAGTTRDAVDALIERSGRRYRLIDTAGIRRKGKTKLMAEKLSVVMARKHLEQADVALIVLDASEGVVALDATIAGYASEGYKSCVLVVNKWDLAQERGLERKEFEQLVRDRFKFLAFAPVVFLSAQRGQGMGRLFTEIDKVARERRRRVSTAELNRFLAVADFDRAPVPISLRLRIYYISQVAVSPPTFVLFVDKARPLHFSYQRYLENQLRRAFGFAGTPILIKTKVSGRK